MLLVMAAVLMKCVRTIDFFDAFSFNNRTLLFSLMNDVEYLLVIILVPLILVRYNSDLKQHHSALCKLLPSSHLATRI